MATKQFYEDSLKNLRAETSQSAELRKPYLKEIEKWRDGRTVVSFFMSFYGDYVLSQSDADQLEEILCNTEIYKGITLILDAPGGDGLAAERIIQICRNYSKGDFETIIPSRAKSAATMICLGSDRILMSPTSELGPIDPQIYYDLTGLGHVQLIAAYSVTKTYQELLDKAVHLTNGRIEPYLQQLSKFSAVHIQSLEQATELAKKIAISALKNGMLKAKSDVEIEELIKQFTDPKLTLSHGRGINLIQAKECGLNIEEIKLSSELWKVVWGLYIRSKHVVESTQHINKLIDTLSDSYYA